MGVDRFAKHIGYATGSGYQRFEEDYDKSYLPYPLIADTRGRSRVQDRLAEQAVIVFHLDMDAVAIVAGGDADLAGSAEWRSHGHARPGSY